MKKPYLLAIAAVVLLSALSIANSTDDPRFFTSSPFTIHVRSTGSDANPHCGETQATACATVKRALDQVPDHWTAPVEIQMGPGVFSIPSFDLGIIPGSYTVGSALKEGSITIRGACETPVATWTSAAGVAVPGRWAQRDFTIPGGWTGTITDASHYVRHGTNMMHAIPRASTSPTLRLISGQPNLPAGILCNWETVITNPSHASYVSSATKTHHPFLFFAGLKFTTAPEFVVARLNGVWIGGGSPKLTDIATWGAYFDHPTTVYLTTKKQIAQGYTDAFWNGCVQLRGELFSLSGVIKGSCAHGLNPQGQLAIGIFEEDHVVFGRHEIRNVNNLDFEGIGPCINMQATDLRVGISSGYGISCNNANGGFARIAMKSQMSITAGAQVTGTVTQPTVITDQSQLGPVNGGWLIVNSGSGGDFTVGSTTNVPLSALPLPDSSRAY